MQLFYEIDGQIEYWRIHVWIQKQNCQELGPGLGLFYHQEPPRCIEHRPRYNNDIIWISGCPFPTEQIDSEFKLNLFPDPIYQLFPHVFSGSLNKCYSMSYRFPYFSPSILVYWKGWNLVESEWADCYRCNWRCACVCGAYRKINPTIQPSST